MEWQPISTAPKDREIILWFPEYGEPVMAHWTKKRGVKRPEGWVFAVNGQHHYRYENPTAWMELPTAPGGVVETDLDSKKALEIAHKVFAAEIEQLQKTIILQQQEIADMKAEQEGYHATPR